jgi:GNAT superfamily N-acetyltransferase
MVAYGNSIPFHWSGDSADLPDAGWDWELDTGMSAAQPANVLGALSITIAKSYQGKGISQMMVETMKEIGKQHGLTALYAPVRPNMKSRYPLTPMERYITWATPTGEPFDPWIRVHARLGAKIVKVCPQSMIITNTTRQWEDWTQMRLPDTGSYIIPGGLVPLEINDETGTYIEPNVWMEHKIDV